MKKTMLLSSACTAVLFLAGCGTTTTIYDPATTKVSVRQEKSVSSEEMRQVTQAAVNSAMTSAKFNSFLRKYRAEMKDPEAAPVLKLAKVVNDTDDPDLNVGEITDMLNEALLNAGKVEVTMAEGAGLSKSVGNSRELENDENFDQKTVAKRGTLKAARLVLRPKVISNTVRTDDQVAVTRTFVMDMADVHTGLVMWKFSKQLAFMKKKGTFGW